MVRGLTKVVVAGDRVGDVEHRLDRDLQRVLDEAFLHLVGVQQFETTELADLGHAVRDECEALVNQMSRAHARRSTARR